MFATTITNLLILYKVVMQTFKHTKALHILLATLIAFSYLLTSGVALLKPIQVKAASTYVVDSNGDEPDDNPGDDTCHTAADTCTLRAAIQEANSHSGGDIINFDAGYTITPASELPSIDEQLEINGYTGSPSGATANTANSPAPFNGTLTVEIDGSSAGASNGLVFANGSDGSSVRGLVINNFQVNGITMYLTGNIIIAGNYLGTDVDGTADAGNIGNGVYIQNSSHNNAVGGIAPQDRNVISGNDNDGVAIGDPGSTSNTVLGNYIGIKADGSATAIGNSSNGVSIFSSANDNLVGGAGATTKNVISGNNNGVYIFSAGSNDIQGNYIGTRYTGTSAQANSSYGIQIVGFSVANTIGSPSDSTPDGNCTGGCNLISGNSSDGISFGAADVTNTTVESNYIGTDVTGTADLGNGGDGVQTGSAVSNTIGGTTESTRNVISGNDQNGVYLSDSSTSNTISGNYIGTSADGTADVGNTNDGVHLEEADSNTIGGTTDVTLGGACTGSCNLVSGNGANGIVLLFNSDSNTVQGNFVGTDASGTASLANVSHGVAIYTSSESNTIGGTATGARNVISGNANNGINMSGTGTNNNVVQGNYIGTDTTGMLDVGNTNGGISIGDGSSGVIIGGTTTSARNVISGNNGTALSLGGTNGVAQGNYIGLNANGSATIYSTAQQMVGINGDNSTFGGTTAGAGNYVAGGGGTGVMVLGMTPFGGSSTGDVVVQGNCIGTNANCEYQAGFGNTNIGLGVIGDAYVTQIGGVEAGAGNTIAGNGAGVGIGGLAGFSPLAASILLNKIYNNSGAVSPAGIVGGIDLFQSADFVNFINIGVTPNDTNDIDYGGTNSGPNHYLNFPVLNSVTSTNGTATINYDLDINDTEDFATGYRVDFYANDVADVSGNGQGQTHIGSDVVSGDVTGRQATITLPAGVDGTKYITAVTTMTTNSTPSGFGHSSEFAADVQATLVPASTNPAASVVAATGRNIKWVALVAFMLLLIGATGLYVAKRKGKNERLYHRI